MAKYSPYANANSSPVKKNGTSEAVVLSVVGAFLVFGALASLCVLGGLVAFNIQSRKALETKQQATNQRASANLDALFQKEKSYLAELNAKYKDELAKQSDQKRDANPYEKGKDLARELSIDRALKRLSEPAEKNNKGIMEASTSRSGLRDRDSNPSEMKLPINVARKLLVSSKEWPLAGIALSPNGKLLAVWRSNNYLGIYDTATGKQTHLLENIRSNEREAKLRFTPDGKTLVAAHESGRVSIWSISETGKITWFHKYRSHTWRIQSLDLSEDGNLILTTGKDSSVCLYDLAKKEVVWKKNDFDAEVWAAQFVSGTSEIIAVNSKKIFKMSRSDGGTLSSVPVNKQVYASDCWFTPDSKRLVWARPGSVSFFDVSTGRKVEEVKQTDPAYGAPILTPDSNHLLLVTSNSIVVWDWRMNRVEFSIPNSKSVDSFLLAVSADQRIVASVNSEPKETLAIFELTKW